jgi:hypothetical protein
MPRTLLQAMSHGNIPRVPDAGPQTHEYLCVHYVDGEEWGLREQVDVCSSYVRNGAWKACGRSGRSSS